MAVDPVRIEIRGLAGERDAAQRDLRETLGALEEKLLPRRAVRRLVTENDPLLVVTGVLALGVALGFARASRPPTLMASLVAAGVAGAIAHRLFR